MLLNIFTMKVVLKAAIKSHGVHEIILTSKSFWINLLVNNWLKRDFKNGDGKECTNATVTVFPP